MFKICFSLPTDCPQRDERKGWMGDAALTVGPALIMFPELERFFIHWLDVIRDSQVVNGNGKGDFVFVFACLLFCFCAFLKFLIHSFVRHLSTFVWKQNW